MDDLHLKKTIDTPIDEAFELEKKKKLKELVRQVKRLDRSLKKSEADIQNCLQWEKKQHEAQLLQANFPKLKRGLDKITLLDWVEDKEITLELNSQLKPQDEVKKRFKQAKKLKLGIEPQKQHFERLKNQYEQILEEIKQVELTKTLNELLLLYPKKKKIEKFKEKPLSYRLYQSKTGFKILAGKNSSCNDALTFSVAKGSDLWLHVKDYPGSHVVICTKRGLDVDQETIGDAAQIAIFHSKAKDANSAEVCITEQKFVSRFGKKRDGKVQISKHKVIIIKPDLKRYKEISLR